MKFAIGYRIHLWIAPIVKGESSNFIPIKKFMI